MTIKADRNDKECMPLSDREQESYDDSLAEWLLEDEEKRRPCAWIRNKYHRERMKQRFHKMHHHGSQMILEGIIYKRTIYLYHCPDDWRTHSAFNFHEGLYVSRRGDVRRFKGKIFAYRNTLQAISIAQRKTYADQANRRIRHTKALEENYVSYSSLKKQYSYRKNSLIRL